MKTKKLLLLLLVSNTFQAFSVKIPIYESAINKVMIIEISKNKMEISAFPEYSIKSASISIDKLNLLDEVQFKIAFVNSLDTFFTIETKSTTKNITNQVVLDSLKKKHLNYYKEYLIQRETHTSTTDESEKEESNFDNQIRITLGWNFNDMQKIPKGSFYGRIAFFTDEIYKRSASKNTSKEYKPKVLGVYSGAFKQGYQIQQTTPHSLIKVNNISTVGTDSISINKTFYSRDTIRTRLEHYGFFFSPCISVWRTERIYNRDTATKKARNHYLWANLDVEYSVFKHLESYSDNQLTTISKHLHEDSIERYNNFNSSIASPVTTRQQIQYGAGFTYSFKTKSIEFIAKYSIGKRQLIETSNTLRQYSNWYFCVSSKTSGFRLGGEIRSHTLDSTNKQIYYNLFVGYSISLNNFAKLFKQP
jgi:hypothetical protein